MMGNYELEDAWGILESLQKEGFCKTIGISNCQKEHIERLSRMWTIIPAVNQVSIGKLAYALCLSY